MQETALLELDHSLRTETIFQGGLLQTLGKIKGEEIRELNSPMLDSKIRIIIDMHKTDINLNLKPELETMPDIKTD